MTAIVDQEFALEDGDFRILARIVREQTGIVVSERKRAFIHSRLNRRVRRLGLPDFAAYCRLLEGPEREDELGMLVNAVTTNHTSFFREPHHFDYLERSVVPALLAGGGRNGRLRIWSAGCATGEEPYSIAMTLCSMAPRLAGWDTKILATDLDTDVLAHAADALYAADRLDTIPASLRSRYVVAETDGRGRIDGAARGLITFKPLNLLEPWPMRGPFDAIFCRNVVIYFDKPTQRRLLDRYAQILKPDGWLFVGHSESLGSLTDRFTLVGRTVYRRCR